MRAKRVPRWMKITGALLAVVLVPVGAFVVWLAVTLSGGLDDLLDRDRPDADDARVVQARDGAREALEVELAAVLRDVPPAPVLARTSGDRCEVGQHDWKVDDDFDLDCTAARAVLLAGTDDAALDASLASSGWTLDPLSASYAEPGRRTTRGFVRGDTRLLVQPVDPVTTRVVSYLLYDAGWELPNGRQVHAEDVAAVVPRGGGTALVLSTGYFRA